MTRFTQSSNCPTTQGAYDTSFDEGHPSGPTGTNQDAFVMKLDSAGTALLYFTFHGGNETESRTGVEYGHGIAVDSLGQAYITGWTGSPDFPTTSGLTP